MQTYICNVKQQEDDPLPTPTMGFGTSSDPDVAAIANQSTSDNEPLSLPTMSFER